MAAHDELLAYLRGHSAGCPHIIDDAKMPQQYKSYSCRVDMLRPLFLAFYRCALMRSVLAFLCGIVLILAARLRSWNSTGIQRAVASTGLVLAIVGARCIRGVTLPGGVPWLEVTTKAGFYCKRTGAQASRNERIESEMMAWLAHFQPCCWQLSGELATMLPFFLNPNRGRHLPYERVWLEMDDGERFAADWVFPPGGFDPERPVVILLTGLAPSKHWTLAGGFVADAAWHLTSRARMSVIVLVARGTMDTQVKKNLFHGARVADLRKLVLFTKNALTSVVAHDAPKPRLFAAGYSMGAIILANYCGVFGDDVRLHGAIHFSGLHDSIANMKFKYSAATWQAYLAYGLKRNFLTPHALIEAAKRGVDVSRVMSCKCSSVEDIDQDFVSVYHGYDGALDYYRDMSLAYYDKWKSVAVPVLSVAARDDPLTHCDALRAKEFSEGNENLLFLVTPHGGHVGWPWGNRPWLRGWDFINEAIETFVNVRSAGV